MRRLLACCLALAAIGAFAPTDPTRAQTPWFVDEAQLPFPQISGARALWGTYADAGYRIEVPANWNGDLVMYAHGYAGIGPALRSATHRSGAT